MQKEAEERIREMQSRARLLGTAENSVSQQKFFQQNQIQKNPAPERSVFSFLEEADSDKIIILALLWILWNEKADRKLLLALLYLLL